MKISDDSSPISPSEEDVSKPLLRSAATNSSIDVMLDEEAMPPQLLQETEPWKCRLREEQELQNIINSKPSLILITGSSGSGKTSLALRFSNRFAYFCRGKFDQMCFATYMPFGAALSDLTEQLLASLDADELSKLKETLPKAVDGEIGLLMTAIPPLSSVLPKQDVPNVSSYQGIELLIRLRHVVTRFLEFVCHERKETVLLFLDDLQWAEPGCLAMLSAILRKQINGLQVIAACRSEEVSVDSALSILLRELEDEGLCIKDLYLRELDIEEVCDFVSHSSGLSKSQCQQCCMMIYQQTEGNLFYTLELFRTLKSMGAVSKKDGTLHCDLEILNKSRNTLSRGAVNDVITLKLQKLSLETQRALALASFMGTRFDSRLVSLALDQDDQYFLSSTEINSLPRIVRQVCHTAYYEFYHDKVQHACSTLLTEMENSQLCLGAARTLVDKLDGTMGVEENAAIISRLLRQSLHLVNSSAEKVKFAEIFFLAGKCFLKSTRFNAAAYKFHDARELLPRRHWRDHYNLSLSIFTASAEVEHVVGHCDNAERLAREVIENARLFLDSVVAHTVTISSYSSQLLFEESIQLGLQLLRKLSIRIPSRAGKLQIAIEVLKTKSKLTKFRTADILSLPVMTCRESQAAMEILAHTLTSAFLSKSPYQVPLSMAMIRLTLEYGMNAESVSAFAMFSVIMAMMSNIELAQQYGRLTLDIMRKYDTKAWVSRVYALVYGLTFIETMSVRKVIEPLMEGYRAGLVSGDTTSSTGCLYFATLFRFLGSESIDELIKFGIDYRKVFNAFRHDNVLILFNIVLQAMENLLGRTADPVDLTGSFLNQKETEKVAEQQGNRAAQSVLCICSIIVAFTMNDYARAERIFDFCQSIPYVHSKFSRCCVLFFGGASKLILAHSSLTGRWRRIRQAKKCIKLVRKRAEMVPEDHNHQVHFLEALLYAVEAKKDRALAAFDEAAVCCEQGDSLLHRALIAEHKSYFLRGCGRDDEAIDSLILSRRTYEKWGAKAKVVQLAAFPFLLKSNSHTGSVSIADGSSDAQERS
jgi:predicted ATPase